MEYIRITFQIALGIIIIWQLFKNSILQVYFSQWSSSLRRQFEKKNSDQR